MENNTTSETPTAVEPVEVTNTTSETPTADEPVEVQTDNNIKLTDVNVSDKNVALNVMVGFLNMAQRRGVFGMDESAKLWEAVNFFIVPPVDDSSPPTVPELSK